MSEPTPVWDSIKSKAQPLLAMLVRFARLDMNQVLTELNVLDSLLAVSAQRDNHKMDTHVFHANEEQSKVNLIKKCALPQIAEEQDRLHLLSITRTAEDARLAQHHTLFQIPTELHASLDLLLPAVLVPKREMTLDIDVSIAHLV